MTIYKRGGKLWRFKKLWLKKKSFGKSEFEDIFLKLASK